MRQETRRRCNRRWSEKVELLAEEGKGSDRLEELRARISARRTGALSAVQREL